MVERQNMKHKEHFLIGLLPVAFLLGMAVATLPVVSTLLIFPSSLGVMPETNMGDGTCGDGSCDSMNGETCDTCPDDCGTACSLTADPHPAANCGDGSCDSMNGETCVTCSSDCGPCPTGCGNGVCEPGEECDSCGGDCGTCPEEDSPGGGCGNGVCSQNETCLNCVSDCGACGNTERDSFCGDGSCDSMDGETCGSCPGDCGECSSSSSSSSTPQHSCGDGSCDSMYGETCDTCFSDCGFCTPQPADPPGRGIAGKIQEIAKAVIEPLRDIVSVISEKVTQFLSGIFSRR